MEFIFIFLVSNLPKLPAIHHDNEFFVKADTKL